MTTDTRITLIKASAGFLAASIVLVTGTVLLMQFGPGNMGKGFAVGGLLVLVGFAVAVWRVARRPVEASSFERSFTGVGDERDRRIGERSSAVVGLVAIPAVAVAAVAIALGVPAEATIAILLYALIAIAVASVVVISRRS